MPSHDDHQESLQNWIESATADLTTSAAQRLKEEFEDHYATAHAEALDTGQSDDEAHAHAMAALGDSRSTHLAAIPVHGDPHRLKVKAGLLLVGIALTASALYYKSTLPTIGPFGTHSLEKAIEIGDVAEIKIQLEAVELPAKDGHFPILMKAFAHDYEDDRIVEICDLLLQHGLDPNSLDQYGRSILNYLVQPNNVPDDYFQNRAKNRATLFDLFVEYGADTGPKTSFLAMSLMEYASFFQDAVIVERLRAQGISESPEALLYQGRYDEVIEWAEREPEILTHRFNHGATILLLLASKGRTAEFKRALELGAKLDQVDDHGKTPLHYAFYSWYGRSEGPSPELLTFLLESGCDANEKDNYDSTPLHYAAGAWSQKEVKILLDYGADPNFRNRANETPLHMSVMPYSAHKVEDEEEVALALIEAGADVNAQTGNVPLGFGAGNTPLHLAVGSHMLGVVRALVEQGASLGQRNEEGQMPIHVAARYTSNYEYDEIDIRDVFDLLLELGADIDARDARGRTPIHLVSGNCKYSCDLEATRYLLEQGADPTIPDERGRTALHIRNRDIKALYKEFGYETIDVQELALL